MCLLGRRSFLKRLPLAALFSMRAATVRERANVWKEPPFSDLTQWITPADRFFVRHHLDIPRIDIADWKLVVGGRVERRLEFTYQQLLRLPRVSEVTTFECAGNLPGGGMVGNAEWTGIRLESLLQQAGIKRDAIEVILDGADFGIDEGENVPVSYARSIPVSKALAPETLLAFEMNGKILDKDHGYPLRAVVPGWYAMTHVKWLRRIEVADRPFSGFYMSKRYFTAKRDSITGEFVISPVREMGLKSQIAVPRNGEVLDRRPLKIRGSAWAGRGRIHRVEVSTDGGKTWNRAELSKERARYAWVFWKFLWKSPPLGEHTITARAFDDQGNTQPIQEDSERVNRYANNWLHRVNVKVH